MITALNKINIKCLFFLIHFVLIACNNEKCGNVVGDNCNISEENFLFVTIEENEIYKYSLNE